jgi:hypothetical protein
MMDKNLHEQRSFPSIDHYFIKRSIFLQIQDGRFGAPDFYQNSSKIVNSFNFSLNKVLISRKGGQMCVEDSTLCVEDYVHIIVMKSELE